MDEIQHLKRQLELKDEECKLKDEECKRVKLENEDLKFECMSKSKTDRVKGISSTIPVEPFPWPCPNEKLIEEAFQELQTKPEVEFLNEDRDLNPCMRDMLETICKKLNVKISWHPLKTLSGPLRTPDICGAPIHSMCAAWPDVKLSFELKLSTNAKKQEGIPESLDYLAAAVAHVPDYETGLHRTRVAIYSDFREIHVLFCRKNGIHDCSRSNLMSLFPSNWRQLKPEEHTGGFRLLCHALAVPMESDRFVVIDGGHCNVVSVLSGELDCFICLVRRPHYASEMVVKVGESKYLEGLLKKEYQNAMHIESLDGMRDYMVPIFPQYSVQHGFAMEYGTVLCDWYEIKTQAADVAVVKSCLIHLLLGVRQLHAQELFHLDIRPGNIIVINDKALLSDWVTCQSKAALMNSLSVFMQGHNDAFWPDVSGGDILQQPALWDWFGVAYTIAFVGATDYKRKLLLDYSKRDGVLSICGSSDYSLHGCGAKMVKRLKEMVPGPESESLVTVDVYEEMRMILEQLTWRDVMEETG